MRTYEIVFVTAPTLSKEELDAYIEQLTRVVEERQARVVKIDRWPKRNLAYRINKFKEGNYVFMTVQANGNLISELERRFKVTDFILRFLSIRVDEELKRAEKIRARRARRVRRAEGQTPQPGQPESTHQ